jgi:hypothetical protein
MNTDSGYFVLANRISAVRQAHAGHIPIARHVRVLLASDGFSRTVDVFGHYRGWQGLLTALRDQPITSIATDDANDEPAAPKQHLQLTPLLPFDTPRWLTRRAVLFHG